MILFVVHLCLRVKTNVDKILTVQSTLVKKYVTMGNAHPVLETQVELYFVHQVTIRLRNF